MYFLYNLLREHVNDVAAADSLLFTYFMDCSLLWVVYLRCFHTAHIRCALFSLEDGSEQQV